MAGELKFLDDLPDYLLISCMIQVSLGFLVLCLTTYLGLVTNRCDTFGKIFYVKVAGNESQTTVEVNDDTLDISDQNQNHVIT